MTPIAATRATPVPELPGWTLYAALVPTLALIVGIGGAKSHVWVPVDLTLFSGLVVLLWLRALRGLPLPGHVLLWPMGAFGALVGAQWAFGLSVYPGATLTELIQLAGCGCVFFMMLCAGQAAPRIRQAAWILWAFCGALSAEAILQYFSADKQIYWFRDASYAEPVGPYVYHNHYAGCMCLLLPIAAAVVFQPNRTGDPDWVGWLRRGLVPALGIASVVVSFSRGGLLALAGEFALCLVIFWPTLRHQRQARAIFLGGAGLLAGFALAANWKPVQANFAMLAVHDTSFLDRLQLAKACFHIFLDHRWLGSGFNTFASIYPAYQTFEGGLVFLYAHNEYAQALAETGIVGAAIILAFLYFWSRALWRVQQSWKRGRSVRALQIAALIGTAGFLLHSVGDFQFHSPANALLFFLVAAMGVAPAREADHKTPHVHQHTRHFHPRPQPVAADGRPSSARHIPL